MTSISIIGAGPAGLMAAQKLGERGFAVTIYDHKPSPARKFLMAGRGGLNITHSEPFEKFILNYTEASEFLRPALENFTPDNLRDWCLELGEETFIGTSGRIFPKSFKASPLLRAWILKLQNIGVKFQYNFEWAGQDLESDITILALGGASWPRLGSDGEWTKILEKQNIRINPFRPANCGFHCKWSDVFKTKFAGHPLKPLILKHHGQSIQGEIIITERGVEGGGIYALSKNLRNAIDKDGTTILTLDLKPNISSAQLEKILNTPRGRDSFSNYMRKVLGLSPVAIGLLQEDREITKFSRADLTKRIKSVPLTLNSVADIARAISSSGGISLNEIDTNFMLKKIPNTYVIGEMLDWEAPTGGYLLQATLSMAVWVGQKIK